MLNNGNPAGTPLSFINTPWEGLDTARANAMKSRIGNLYELIDIVEDIGRSGSLFTQVGVLGRVALDCGAVSDVTANALAYVLWDTLVGGQDEDGLNEDSDGPYGPGHIISAPMGWAGEA